jgi:cellulose 1,4-beta-cellobiosidase
MSKSMDKGMVLVMSLWDDHAAKMLWLDSTYPVDKTTLGGPRGSCSTSSGDPSQVEREDANAYVEYSNIRLGEIGSTYKDLLYNQDEKTMFIA